MVPVLGNHDILERGGELVDQRDDLIALLNGKTAPWNEAILHIDHNQHALFVGTDF